MKVTLTGIVWYIREDYARLMVLMEDTANLTGPFDAWLVKAEFGEQQLRQSGVRVVRVIIDPDTFPAWCAAQKLKINAEARNRYCVHKITQQAAADN